MAKKNDLKKELPNFLELPEVEEANKVDSSEYRFERYSESKGYIFVRRAKRQGL